ncbi:MAG: hypothetical protein J5728_08395 [Lachnospiraceae bacterium]|nr:hypothetical protein [Lachnospiraceae bacterium]
MSKKNKKILVIALAVIAVFVAMIVMIPEGGYSEKTATVVRVENSKASPEYLQTVVEIKKSGSYILNPDWMKNEQPGFLTGFSMADGSGRIVYSTVGGLMKTDSAPVELAEGKYICRFDYICSNEDLLTYANEHAAYAEQSPVIGEIPGASEWFRDGTWEMVYSLRVYEANRFMEVISIACGAVLGFLLVLLIVTISRNENAAAKKYDERQIAEQGKAYKYGFFTMFAFLFITMILGDVLAQYAEMGLVIFIDVMIASCVMVTYSIMHDAYFRMDESRRFFIIFFAFMAVFNIGIGIVHIIRDEIFENGVLDMTSNMNLICGIFILYVMIVLLIKKLRDREED